MLDKLTYSSAFDWIILILQLCQYNNINSYGGYEVDIPKIVLHKSKTWPITYLDTCKKPNWKILIFDLFYTLFRGHAYDFYAAKHNMAVITLRKVLELFLEKYFGVESSVLGGRAPLKTSRRITYMILYHNFVLFG